MNEDKKDKVKKAEDEKDVEAPVSAICEGASAHAAAQIKDDSEIKPVEGFFLTSQRWH